MNQEKTFTPAVGVHPDEDLRGPLRQEGESEYTWVRYSGSYAYITVGSITVQVKRDDEGVVIDLYAHQCEDCDPLGSTYLMFSEADELRRELGRLPDPPDAPDAPDRYQETVRAATYRNGEPEPHPEAMQAIHSGAEYEGWAQSVDDEYARRQPNSPEPPEEDEDEDDLDDIPY